ncbi:MAG: phosphatase PAP2 family protein [Bacteroidota bacterium]
MKLLQYDIAILDWLNSHLIPGSTPVLQFVSNFATFFSIVMALIVLSMAIIKKSKPLFHKTILIALALILSAIMIQVLKEAFDRERPFMTYPFIEKLSTGGGSSFPSGHTMEAYAMAMVMSILFRYKWLIVTVYTWAFLVAYSRLALGVHYPADVLSGIMVGTLIGWFVPWIYRIFLSHQTSDASE